MCCSNSNDDTRQLTHLATKRQRLHSARKVLGDVSEEGDDLSISEQSGYEQGGNKLVSEGSPAVTLLRRTDLYDSPEECQDLAPKLESVPKGHIRSVLNAVSSPDLRMTRLGSTHSDREEEG
jgi:hypothetical protein